MGGDKVVKKWFFHYSEARQVSMVEADAVEVPDKATAIKVSHYHILTLLISLEFPLGVLRWATCCCNTIELHLRTLPRRYAEALYDFLWAFSAFDVSGFLHRRADGSHR